MRKRIISFLFENKLNWIIPVFHRLVGHTKIVGKRFNQVVTNTSNLFFDSINIRGGDNTINMGSDSSLEYSSITIKGNHNCIFIGSRAFINGLAIIIEGDNNRVFIGDDAFVFGDTRVYVVDGSSFSMGKGCMLSDHIEIRTTDNHSILDINTGTRINPEENIILGDEVWIGTGVTILKGTEIAEGCIVGAGSVISRKHTIPHSIIAGNPGKEIKNDVKWVMERV